MKFLTTVAIALLLLVIESVVVHYVGLSVTRIDVTVALVVFLALRANTLEGAISSYAIGYLLDVMSGNPTGLYPFLAVLTFLATRLVSSLVDVRSLFAFVAFAMGADLGHGLTAVLLTWLTSKDGTVAAGSLSNLPIQVFLTGLAAVAMWPLLRRIDPGNDRPEVGALR